MTAIALNPIHLLDLIDPPKCYALIGSIRWGEIVICHKCGSHHVIKRGFDETQGARQRYQCKQCQARFDDLTDTIFAGHHQPLGVWILCLYLMGLNLSNCQIAQELDLNKDDAQQMTAQLRSGIVPQKPEVVLESEVEIDEVYLVAGFLGQPLKVAQKQRKGRRRRLNGKPGRGTLEQEKPPIFGMMQRGGEVVIKMLDNVQQVTIKPLIQKAVALGTLVYTDEYAIYQRLDQWGYSHKTVCHGSGEYARDEDGDGFDEVHVNTIEGFWSLLRSRIRPHRGISQDKLPLYLGFFEGWLHRRIVDLTTMKWSELGGQIKFVYARGTSSNAFDGSGKVKRSKTSYELATFRTGKQYNADLSGSYNIGARFILKLLGGNSPQDEQGKSSCSSPRSWVTLSMLWSCRPTL